MRFFILALLAAPLFPQNWISLFNGSDLTGWRQCNGQASYRVQDNTIVGTTAEGSPNSFLCTDRNYSDFILEFEVLVDPKLNSGVQIRSHQYPSDTEVVTGGQPRKHAAGRVYGYQVEIATEATKASGGIYDEARRGWLDNPGCTSFKDSQWNRYRVEARVDRIRTWVNGVACANVTDSKDAEGFIALQVHSFKGDQPAQVRWRNLRIQILERSK